MAAAREQQQFFIGRFDAVQHDAHEFRGKQCVIAGADDGQRAANASFHAGGLQIFGKQADYEVQGIAQARVSRSTRHGFGSGENPREIQIHGDNDREPGQEPIHRAEDMQNTFFVAQPTGKTGDFSGPRMLRQQRAEGEGRADSRTLRSDS